MRSRARRNRFRCTDSKAIVALMAIFFFFGTALLQSALSSIGGDPFPDNLMRRGDEEWHSYHRHLQVNLSGDTEEEMAKKKKREFPFCVAVLTGFPDSKRSMDLVIRILKELLFSLDVDPLQLKVYCQGTECFQKLAPKLGNESQLNEENFVELNNKVNRSLYKGFIISENYRLMLEDLFHVQNHKYCIILEDDLVLSRDAIFYLNAGRIVMERDKTIFAVSLYNDNSYPWCSSNPDFFRRTDQFSGLGFITSREIYQKFIRSNWKSDITWDALFQNIVLKNNMASIQPEVGRVLHTSNTRINATQNGRLSYNQYEAQNIYTGSILLNGYRQLLETVEDKYDAFIRHFVPSARVIRHLRDAGFVSGGVNLVMPNFDSGGRIGAVLSQAKLVGPGLGGLVRGIYKGSLFLRINGNLVLLLSKDSPFYSPFLNSKLKELDVETAVSSIESLLKTQSIGRDLIGSYYNLKHNHHLVVSNSSQSCSQVCIRSNTRCSLSGMWLLNSDCSILQGLFPHCKTCNTEYMEPTVRKGDNCQIGSSYLLSCTKTYTNKSIRQLCACR